MDTFAFILHPLEIRDVARKFGFARKLPDRWLEALFRRAPALKVSEITGVRSVLGNEVKGWFVACPLTARQMLELPEPYVMRKINQAARKAEELGAKIVGLGAFTSVVGDAGITVAKAVNIAVTTGNSYTVATALQGGIRREAPGKELRGSISRSSGLRAPSARRAPGSWPAGTRRHAGGQEASAWRKVWS